MRYMDLVVEQLDKATSLDPGEEITLQFATPQERERWRMTAYRAIRLDRDASRQSYQPGEFAYDKSRWHFLEIVPRSKTALTLRLCQGPRVEVQKTSHAPLASRT